MPLLRHVKYYKIRKNPLEELQEKDFKSKYRFSRSTTSFIIDMVKNDLAGDSRGGFIPPHLKVLAAIRTWAREEFQDDAGDISGISQPTISLICKQVALAIVAQRAQWIKMPQTDAEQNNVIAGFYSLCGFRQVIGAIDCTHIRIPKVGGDVGQYYIYRKGYSSINVQVVANANLEIMDYIVAHWRGSTHDSKIFNESSLKQRFERSEFKGRLLGDSGYACTPYLFTPVLRPTTEKEEMYNKAHIRTRNVVERCFGVWKQRFQCLLRGFSTKLENTILYIVTLAVLHNIAMHRQDLEEGEASDDTVPVTPAINTSLRGNSVRAAFINEN
ncbi:LOW QUALITY PROTEIN: putative nuclease HARBI1 [Cydia pomonella]|uniref:LOW QUALITY PROTEIN: putative nuclease HARBI1 n=1 Tax=Cydia pomonella TaxID=82600 RepID=UPI002ADD49B2|nr:LOW QUALITY PROTEIN: putative nuclease HARBI1 [Cydia pomonella]